MRLADVVNFGGYWWVLVGTGKWAPNTSRSGGRAWGIDKACGTAALIRLAALVHR